jgi:predicted outer membrane repeat protein
VCCSFLTTVSYVPAFGADIYVASGGTGDGSISSPTDLQSALDAARTNGEDDTLYLQQGNYDAGTSGAGTFEYGTNSNDNMAVTLRGGWNSGYTVQSGDPALTMLDGKDTAPVLHILADAAGVSYNIALDTLAIQNGMTTGNGAGIMLYTGVSGTSGAINLTLRNSLFQNNDAAQSGGGLYSNGYLEVYDSTFSSNSASTGGAIAINDVPDGDHSLSPLIQNGTFNGNDNAGGWQGSAVYNGGVALRVKGSRFTNSSGTGSPLYNHAYASLDIVNSVFSGNTTPFWGSAIQFWDAGGRISNCLFYDNEAGTSSGFGAITYYDNLGVGPGPATITIINSTFVRNQSGGTGAGAIHNRYGNFAIYNSIFWDNEGMAGIVNQSGSITISYSDVHGGVPPGTSNGGNNIDMDPLFVNMSGLSDSWDLHVQADPVISPSIDAGNNSAPGLPAYDLDNGNRISDGDNDGTPIVDMGAYEYSSSSHFFIIPGKNNRSAIINL